jgi:hypothetical protein
MTVHRSAVISECGKYRYLLSRRWATGPVLAFIMLNPSTADGFVDDQTVRKCIVFAKRFGFNGIEVVNLFAYRATKPADMLAAADPVGPENNAYVDAVTLLANDFVCAWGTNARKSNRPAQVLSILHHAGVRLKCLRITRDGHPGHPLMLSYDCALVAYQGAQP